MKKLVIVGDLHENLENALPDSARVWFDSESTVDEILDWVKYNLEKELFTPETFVENHVFIKGNIHSSRYLKILIEVEKFLGLRSRYLAHCGLFSKDGVDTGFVMTDGAFNINPKPIELMQQIVYAADLYRDVFGEDPLEKAGYILAEDSPKIVDYDKIQDLKEHVEVMQFDVFLSESVRKVKGITLDAVPNILVVPNINVGNVVWKSLAHLGGYDVLGVVVGLPFKAVLLSRGDSLGSYIKSIEWLLK